MQTLITGGTILTPDQVIVDQTLVIEGEKILCIAQYPPAKLTGNRIIDVAGRYVVPGFIDVHIHGASGADTMDATHEAIMRMAKFCAQHGVTTFLPTTVTASEKDLLEAIKNVSATPCSSEGAQHPGIHLEGPHLSEAYRGAQPSEHLRPANPDEYGCWLRNKDVRLITVAPEVDGVLDLVKAGKEAGVEFAVGHSGATYEQVLAAVDLGLHQAAHTFNGMPGLNHRIPGVLGAILSDERIWAQIIADGIHVHPAIVKLLIKTKGIDRTILITDAIRATGMPDGDHALGNQMVQVKDGIARTDAGGLAGSTLTMDQALRNVMAFGNLSLLEALPMATRVPAAAIRLENHKGCLAAGFDADLVVLDDLHHVCMTMVGGRVVYNNL
jgi:N-acetylglucosamine-6-phosphate deacetylase